MFFSKFVRPRKSLGTNLMNKHIFCYVFFCVSLCDVLIQFECFAWKRCALILLMRDLGGVFCAVFGRKSVFGRACAVPARTQSNHHMLRRGATLSLAHMHKHSLQHTQTHTLSLFAFSLSIIMFTSFKSDLRKSSRKCVKTKRFGVRVSIIYFFLLFIA